MTPSQELRQLCEALVAWGIQTAVCSPQCQSSLMWPKDGTPKACNCGIGWIKAKVQEVLAT